MYNSVIGFNHTFIVTHIEPVDHHHHKDEEDDRNLDTEGDSQGGM